MDDNYCSNWPKWLRYFLTVPAAAICSILAGMFIPYFFVLYLNKNSMAYELTYTISGAIAFIFVAQYILYTMPPKHKLTFLFLFSVPWFIICYYDIFGWIFTDYVLNSPLTIIVEAITLVIMGAYCVCDHEEKYENTEKEKKMKNTLIICLTLITCVCILCFTILYQENSYQLTDGEIEALTYLGEKADDVEMTIGEYIQAVKDYEAEQIAINEYFEKVENGTNTRVDDLKAERNGWLD